MALENYRIIEYPEKTEVDTSDYMLVDSESNGTNKYQVKRIITEAEAKVTAAVAAEADAREAADEALQTDINTRATKAELAAETAAREQDVADLKADLSETGNEIIRTAGIVEEMECGLTDSVKTTLLNCFSHVVWVDEHGQNYYDALSAALNHTRVLSSISAVFAQGAATIYDTDELYALKQYLTVIATYSDGTTREVTNYTLTGTLTAGTSTITVAYNKKTTTFNVTVTHRTKTLESITATFNSSATITTDNDLDDLRPYLTVRGQYSDGSTDTITNYVLSGSLNVGVNTITVRYGGKTATFNVTVTEAAVTVQSITATFNQGSAVIYTNSSLDDLRPYLTVIARYSNGTTQTVTNYTLSGTLTAGTSTITASHSGKTATFNVTVTASGRTLSNITALFNQGSNKVYESTALDTLKQYLTVTAHYSDNTTAIITNYTLSGSLVGGQNSPITAVYTEGNIAKSVSFTVAVETILYDWDFTRSLYDEIDNIYATPTSDGTQNIPSRTSAGVVFDEPTQVLTLISGDEQLNHLDMTVEIDVASFDFKGDSTKHVRFFMDQRGDASNSVGTGALIFRATYGWTSYGYSDANHTDSGYRKWSDTGWGSLYNTDQINALNGKTVKIYYGADGHTRKLYLDGTLIGTMTDVYFYKPTLRLRLGGGMTLAQSSGDQCYDMTISGVRIYRGEV